MSSPGRTGKSVDGRAALSEVAVNNVERINRLGERLQNIQSNIEVEKHEKLKKLET